LLSSVEIVNNFVDFFLFVIVIVALFATRIQWIGADTGRGWQDRGD